MKIYLPIFLTCLACKLMEHISISAIVSHHGFRCGQSCKKQLLGYVNETNEQLERGNQEDTIVIDFPKAFDKVSHTLASEAALAHG